MSCQTPSTVRPSVRIDSIFGDSTALLSSGSDGVMAVIDHDWATDGQRERERWRERLDWIGLSSVLRPRQHSVCYMGDCFYRSKDPTNSIKVLKEQIVHRQMTRLEQKWFISCHSRELQRRIGEKRD